MPPNWRRDHQAGGEIIKHACVKSFSSLLLLTLESPNPFRGFRIYHKLVLVTSLVTLKWPCPFPSVWSHCSSKFYRIAKSSKSKGSAQILCTATPSSRRQLLMFCCRGTETSWKEGDVDGVIGARVLLVLLVSPLLKMSPAWAGSAGLKQSQAAFCRAFHVHTTHARHPPPARTCHRRLRGAPYWNWPVRSLPCVFFVVVEVDKG